MANAVLGSKFLFNDPVPLSVELHGDIGVTPTDAPYTFAATAHISPISESEIGHVCADYPIIFMGEEKTPVAVLGAKPNVNQFVDERGQWRDGCHVPAYLRQYPFVLAKEQKGDGKILCIDREATLIDVENPKYRFFEDAKPSAFLNNAIDFCTSLDLDLERIQMKSKKLDELGLLETMSLTQGDAASKEAAPAMQFVGINEAKIAKLTSAQKLSLVDDQLFALIYGQLFSQKNWPSIFTGAAK